MSTFYRNDDTAAFGQRWLAIELDLSDFTEEERAEIVITKAELQCGMLFLEFENPQFPLEVALTREQTKKLTPDNRANLRVYDKDGLRTTCDGYLEFCTKKEVVYG